jgi:adenine-specific DNA-methyltransferase
MSTELNVIKEDVVDVITVKIKEFKEEVINEEDFKQLSLKEQKKMFLSMLDLNQMYVQKSEMEDKKYGIGKKDQKLTKMFYLEG